MADRLCDEIIAGLYKADDRIPSVREYAVTLEVNTNTAVKAYELLAREEIIYNKRGLGYFVSPDAQKQILTQRKKEFMNEMLPELFWKSVSRKWINNGINTETQHSLKDVIC